MSSVTLSQKGAKLMKLCDQRGFEHLDDLLLAALLNSACPAICMTEGCDHMAEMEPDQNQGFCDACGGNTVVSALVLADLI